LVNWGFPYGDIRNIPIDEVESYIKMINEYNERKRKAEEGTPDDNVPAVPKTVGNVNPTAF